MVPLDSRGGILPFEGDDFTANPRMKQACDKTKRIFEEFIAKPQKRCLSH